MICPKCGRENRNGARFCAGCGAPIAQQAQPGQQAPRMQSQAGASYGYGQQTQAPRQQAARPAGAAARQQAPRQAAPARRQSAYRQQSAIGIGTILVGIGALLMLISSFVSFVKESLWGYSVAYTYFNFGKYEDDGAGFVLFCGILVIAFAVGCALLKFFRKRVVGIVISSIALLYGLLEFAFVAMVVSEAWGAHYGPSCFLMMIGAILSIVGSCFRS